MPSTPDIPYVNQYQHNHPQLHLLRNPILFEHPAEIRMRVFFFELSPQSSTSPVSTTPFPVT